MTLFYPDLSAYQAGIPISGPAVCVKATEGTGWASSDYGPALARARAAGTFAFAYAFLHAGNPAAQAQWAFRHVGGQTGLMLDWEPTTGSRPGTGDALGFLDEYKRLGGTCNLTYLPRWYWEQLGCPSLAPLAQRGHGLVSSNYTYYTDDPNGAGWQPYGGISAPKVWQHTASHQWNGQPVDWNAFKGTLAELQALVTGGQPPRPPGPPPPFPYPPQHYLGQPSPSPYAHSGYYGGPDNVNVHTWQARMAARGWAIIADGRFGQQSENAARAFQAEKGLQADGKVGRDTWTVTFTAPVT